HNVGPSYQLAVVVDDAMMGVNQVIRGADLVTSTPRQLLLYRALGRPAPVFGHVSLAVDTAGRRLAKRDNAPKLATLREAGVDPAYLIGSLIRGCGWSEAVLSGHPGDWIDRADLSAISTEPWVVTDSWLERLRAVR